MTHNDVLSILQNYNWSDPKSNASDLDKYLRGIYKCMVDKKDEPISASLILEILKDAEYCVPTPYTPSWEKTLMMDPEIEIPDEEFNSYEHSMRFLEGLIAEKRKASASARAVIEKANGKQIPHWQFNGQYATWVNCDIPGIIDALTPYGSNNFGKKEIGEDQINWRYIPDLITMGIMYE